MGKAKDILKAMFGTTAGKIAKGDDKNKKKSKFMDDFRAGWKGEVKVKEDDGNRKKKDRG